MQTSNIFDTDAYKQRMADREAAEKKIADAFEQAKYSNNKIRLIYSEPVTFKTGRFHSVTNTVHIISYIFKSSFYGYCYSPKRNSRRGWEIPLENLVSIEKIKRKPDVFNSLEEFAKRFDKRFVTQEEIKRLWESKSGQHGNQYRPSDFRRVSKVMKEKVKCFVEIVKDINSLQDTKDVPQGFIKNEFGSFYCTVDHESYHHTGRDISISYKLNKSFVWYSSEFHRCGNGSYGILATESTWLHLEDD